MKRQKGSVVKKVGNIQDKTMLSRFFSYIVDFPRGFSMLTSTENFWAGDKVYSMSAFCTGSSFVRETFGTDIP